MQMAKWWVNGRAELVTGRHHAGTSFSVIAGKSQKKHLVYKVNARARLVWWQSQQNGNAKKIDEHGPGKGVEVARSASSLVIRRSARRVVSPSGSSVNSRALLTWCWHLWCGALIVTSGIRSQNSISVVKFSSEFQGDLICMRKYWHLHEESLAESWLGNRTEVVRKASWSAIRRGARIVISSFRSSVSSKAPLLWCWHLWCGALSVANAILS